MTQRAVAPQQPAWIRWTIVGGQRPAGIPRKVPKSWQRDRAWFRPWGRWKAAGGTGPRPAIAPKEIPTWAQQLVREPEVRRALLADAAPATRPPYYALHRGALLNEPDGAGWDFEAFRREFGDYVALNLRATHGGWDDVRARAERAGVEVAPWARLGHPHLGDTKDDCLRWLEHLLETATAWETKRPIVNAEGEIKPASLGGLITPDEIARELDSAGMDEAAISTEAWVYDMHWIPVTRYAVLLQILPRDNRWTPDEVRAQQRACVERAHGYGFEHVGSSVQTYEMADGSHPNPGWFDLMGPTSLIWGDNAGGWRRWRP